MMFKSITRNDYMVSLKMQQVLVERFKLYGSVYLQLLVGVLKSHRTVGYPAKCGLNRACKKIIIFSMS